MDGSEDTAPAIGRDSATEHIQPIEHTNEWLDEFQKQLSATLMNRLKKYAAERARIVARSGRKVDSYYVDELAHDVVTDTWSKTLTWDPMRCTLEKHLVRAIESRTDKHYKRQLAAPHIYIGDYIGDDEDPVSLRAEEEASSVVAHSTDSVCHVYVRETMAQIRVLAARDKCVLRILDAYDAGAYTKEEVVALTKMKPRTYHNAHIRLSRLVRGMNDHAPKARA